MDKQKGLEVRILTGADVPKNPNSGASGTIYYTNLALRKLGHEVDEIWKEDIPHKIHHGNLHYLLELPKGYRDAIRKRCKGNDYDVIQISQPYAWLAAREHHKLNRKGVFVNRSHGLELMAYEILPVWHKKLGIPENRFPRSLFSIFLRKLLKRHTFLTALNCDGMVVPALDIADFLISRVNMPEKKLAVIAHGVSDVFVTRKPAAMTEKRLNKILYVGQYSFNKGPHILANALTNILNKNHNVEATWVCDVHHHEKVKQLFNPAIIHRVKLCGWMQQEDLLDLYDSHGIFMFTSFYEGAGKACLEAMVRGMCVVGSNVGAMRDYIEHGENGFLVSTGDIEGFTTVTGKLLKDIQLCMKISRVARLSTIDYTWRRCAEGLTEFYKKLLARTLHE